MARERLAFPHGGNVNPRSTVHPSPEKSCLVSESVFQHLLCPIHSLDLETRVIARGGSGTYRLAVHICDKGTVSPKRCICC